MNNSKLGNRVTTVALALIAGVIGCVLTLLVTGFLPVTSQPSSAPVEQASQSANSELANRDQPDSLSGPFTRLADDADTSTSSEFLAALQNAADERAQLAKILAQLTQQVENLESDAINRRAFEQIHGSTDTDSDSASQDLPDIGDFGPSLNASKRVRDLVAAGVDYDSALAFQARQDSYQLARLELFDLAEREGWIDSDQFATRLDELDSERLNLREELGDEPYDRYLFEAGRNNRVVIDSIIPGSTAELAGLQPGDMVFSYAQGRIFSTNDLQRATRAGVRGESVAMQVERQGQALFFEVLRGPLGVTLRAEKKNPS